jgi:hypothetical protein
MMKALPHRNLYTRLQASSNGVGVFAIRDIPEGTVLFLGDVGATVRVPIGEVESIEDQEVRRMYFDFCPLVDGAFVCPADFNQLTMGWYTNHSDHPNVNVDEELRFSTHRLVLKGEEITTDYTRYSEHARHFLSAWNR